MGVLSILNAELVEGKASCNYVDAETYLGSAKLITITAKKNYVFDKSKYNYYITYGLSNTKANPTISSDLKTLTFAHNASMGSAATIKLDWTNINPTYSFEGNPITINLTGSGFDSKVTCNYEDGDFYPDVPTIDNALRIQLDGNYYIDYKFSEDVRYATDNLERSYAFTKSYYEDFVWQLVFMEDLPENVTDIYINTEDFIPVLKVEPEPDIVVNVTGSGFVNCSCNYGDLDVYDSVNKLTVTADSGYVLEDDIIYITDNEGNEYGLTKTDGVYGVESYSLEVVLSTDITDIYINSDDFIAEEIEYPTIQNFTVEYLVRSFVNCSCNYENGELYDTSKPLTITADYGYEFVGSFPYYIDTSDNNVFSDDITHNFTNYGNKLVAETIPLDVDAVFVWFESTDGNDFVAVEATVAASPFANIYNPTDTELFDLSKVRYWSNATGTDVLDRGQYIYNLYKLPYNIPESVLGSPTNIHLGDTDTGVESVIVKDYILTIDLGEINVTSKYDNVYDYINTDFILHVPYFNKIYLNSEYVVDETISIVLDIELYTGKGTLKVRSSFVDNSVIESLDGIVVSQIPFMQDRNASGVLSISNKYIPQAYIEVVRNKPYSVDTNVFGRAVIEFGVIGDYVDFVKCENVLLNTSATNTEKDEIKSLLKSGVII